MTTPGAASQPGEAGTSITRLPVGSRRLVHPRLCAHRSNQRAMASSFFEQRGIALIRSNQSRIRSIAVPCSVSSVDDDDGGV